MLPFLLLLAVLWAVELHAHDLVTKEYFFAKKRPLYTKKRPFVRNSPILIVTFYAPGTGHEADLERLTCPNKRGYAAANGYDFINAFEHDDLQDEYVRNYNMNPNKTPQMFKLRLLPLLITTYGYEWVMWSDADAIFLNWLHPLEPHLDARFDVIFATNSPAHPTKALMINSGHFFVRNCAWSISFLYQCYGLSFVDCWEFMQEKRPFNEHYNLCPSRNKRLFQDQLILQYFITYTPHDLFGCHFKHVDLYHFDSEFPDYSFGDMVVHIAGYPVARKAVLLDALLKACDCASGTCDITDNPELTPIKNPTRTPQHLYEPFNRACTKK